MLKSNIRMLCAFVFGIFFLAYGCVSANNLQNMSKQSIKPQSNPTQENNTHNQAEEKYDGPVKFSVKEIDTIESLTDFGEYNQKIIKRIDGVGYARAKKLLLGSRVFFSNRAAAPQNKTLEISFLHSYPKSNLYNFRNKKILSLGKKGFDSPGKIDIFKIDDEQNIYLIDAQFFINQKGFGVTVGQHPSVYLYNESMDELTKLGRDLVSVKDLDGDKNKEIIVTGNYNSEGYNLIAYSLIKDIGGKIIPKIFTSTAYKHESGPDPKYNQITEYLKLKYEYSPWILKYDKQYAMLYTEENKEENTEYRQFLKKNIVLTKQLIIHKQGDLDTYQLRCNNFNYLNFKAKQRIKMNNREKIILQNYGKVYFSINDIFGDSIPCGCETEKCKGGELTLESGKKLLFGFIPERSIPKGSDSYHISFDDWKGKNRAIGVNTYKIFMFEGGNQKTMKLKILQNCLDLLKHEPLFAFSCDKFLFSLDNNNILHVYELTIEKLKGKIETETW